MSKDFLGRKDPNGIVTVSAYIANPSKSADAQAAAREAENAFYNPKIDTSIEDIFLKGVAWQRELEAELQIQISCLEKALMVRDEREKAIVEALELALSFAPKGPVPEGLAPMFYHTLNYEDEVKLQARIDEARAALLKYRGGE
jgi:hypothetical protein